VETDTDGGNLKMAAVSTASSLSDTKAPETNPLFPFKDTPTDLLNSWRIRTKRAQLAHRLAAKSRSRAHIVIGMMTIIISTCVGGFVFTNFAEISNNYFKIAGGMLSLLAAALSAL